MANEEHLCILEQGVEAWNRWRLDRPSVSPDLSTETLVNLSWFGANFRGANFTFSDLSWSRLSGVDLSEAILARANLTSAVLEGTDFGKAVFGYTVLGDIDLSTAKGLDSVIHDGPSTVGIDTIIKSGGGIPEIFLRGCGFNDADIEYAKLARPGLSNEEISDITYRIYHLKATQAVQISPLFISYSHDDGLFVDKTEQHLNEKGIRYWRDVHHATAGRLEKQIDRAMRLNPTVLLVLSEHSAESDWVEHEAASARELEKKLKRDVLCPVALDDSWKTCSWPMVLRRRIMDYNILDFSNWQDDDFFSGQFNKLIEGLHIFYQDERPEQ